MQHQTQSLVILVFSLLIGMSNAPVAAFDDSEIVTLTYPGWFKPNLYHLGEDLAEARENDKRGVLVFFSTAGCSYCKLMLQETFADPRLAKRLQTEFDVIGLEMFDDTEITDGRGATLPVKDFAVREGAQFSPTLLFYDTNGETTLRLVGYYDPARLTLALDYLAERRAGGEGFKTWLERRQATPADRSAQPSLAETTALIEDSLFAAPPYRLDRSHSPAERPLLVIFEGRQCPDCLRLHREVLIDPEVRKQLAGFERVRLDAADKDTPIVIPSGSTTTPAQWKEALGFTHLPAMVWFDQQGRQVLATDALVLKGRLLNSLGYVRDRAYAKGWTYQRYARSENIRRLSDTRAH